MISRFSDRSIKSLALAGSKLFLDQLKILFIAEKERSTVADPIGYTWDNLMAVARFG